MIYTITTHSDSGEVAMHQETSQRAILAWLRSRPGFGMLHAVVCDATGQEVGVKSPGLYSITWTKTAPTARTGSAVNAYLSDDEKATAARIGGTVSNGLRMALAAYK